MAALPYINLATDREEVSIAEAAGLETTELALREAVAPNPAVASEVETYVREYFADVPILAEIARCESTFRHHNPKTGSILRGVVNSNDIGVMQINTYYHHDTALKLGFEIETLDGNLGYARNLYEREGTRPWNASHACWGAKHLAMR